jgi:hypothetical protein
VSFQFLTEDEVFLALTGHDTQADDAVKNEVAA